MHLALSVVFGLGFAAPLALVPRLGTPGLLLLSGIGYGLALWVVNFVTLGHTLFPFFTNPAGPDIVVELIVHPLLFGLPPAAFLLGTHRA